VRLGKYTGLLGVTSSSVIHNGIWGYATGEWLSGRPVDEVMLP
jgi:hypothetical protein